MTSRTVLLYGRSLLLAGVAASLARCPGLQVAQAATWTEASRLLAECMPDVLIFDLTDTCESRPEGHGIFDILALLFKNPHLLLIGLDAECNRAVLVSGQEAQSLSLSKIEEIVFHSEPAQ